MAKLKITARKYEGDDAASWAVFIDGRVYVTGLTKSEVPHYKTEALRSLIPTGCTCPLPTIKGTTIFRPRAVDCSLHGEYVIS